MDITTRLWIQDACMRLSLRYAFALDHRDYEAFANVFAPDALWNGPPGQSCDSREAIRRFLAKRDPRVRKRHVVSNFLIEVLDERSARGVVYWTEYVHPDAPGDEPAVFSGANALGEYRDDYVRLGDEWFIARRITQRVFHREARSSFSNPDSPA